MKCLLTERQLTRALRDLNAHSDGPYTLSLSRLSNPPHICDHDAFDAVGREEIPGDALPFDAVAVARRLLAAWRDAQGVFDIETRPLRPGMR